MIIIVPLGPSSPPDAWPGELGSSEVVDDDIVIAMVWLRFNVIVLGATVTIGVELTFEVDVSRNRNYSK